MPFDNVLRQIKAILYRLKRNYGVAVKIIRMSNLQDNIETGKMSQDRQEIPIRRAIVGPALALRAFVYDLSYIAANKNFTYGGFFDAETRIMIIDSKDLPSGFEPNQDDYVIYEDRPYQFKEIHPLAKKYGWSMVLKQVDAIPDES